MVELAKEIFEISIYLVSQKCRMGTAGKIEQPMTDEKLLFMYNSKL